MARLKLPDVLQKSTWKPAPAENSPDVHASPKAKAFPPSNGRKPKSARRNPPKLLIPIVVSKKPAPTGSFDTANSPAETAASGAPKGFSALPKGPERGPH